MKHCTRQSPINSRRFHCTFVMSPCFDYTLLACSPSPPFPHSPLPVQPSRGCFRLRGRRRRQSGAATGDARSRQPCQRHCRREIDRAGPPDHHEALQGGARGLRRRCHVPRPRKPHARTGETFACSAATVEMTIVVVLAVLRGSSSISMNHNSVPLG